MANKASYGIERVDKSERIASLDVTRGLAILFILFMNIMGMAGYWPAVRDIRIPTWEPIDHAAMAVQFAYFSGTQRGLLELLFGAGIMIMARAAMAPTGPVSVADLHYKRNLLLILLGLFNALVLLWPGDILLPYGIVAIALFPFRLLKPRGQLLAAAGFLLLSMIPGALYYQERSQMQAAAQQVAAATAAGRTVDAETKELAAGWDKAVKATVPLAQNPEKQKLLAEARANRLGSFGTYAQARWSEWMEFLAPGEFFPVLAEIAATMLLGMALFQLGIMQGRAPLRVYLILLAAGYGIGLLLRIHAVQEWWEFSPRPKLFWLHNDVSRIAVTLGHLAAIHLALTTIAGRRLLAPFQAPGRMPLTIYLFTSFLTMWVLFPGFGLGLHGRWGMAGMMGIAALIIAGEVVATNLWMRKFETGPMEWLWKSLAYGKRQPYRRQPAVEPIPAAAE